MTAAGALALALAVAGGACGRPVKVDRLVPSAEGVESVQPLNASPLADASLALLPLELADGVEAPTSVLEALAAQHRRSLREMQIVGRVYASLTEAEADGAGEGGAPLLRLRGTVQEYRPTYQRRLGQTVRVALEMKIKYDVSNVARSEETVTLWAAAQRSEAFLDVEAPEGDPQKANVRENLAKLLQKSFERFNQSLASNSRVVELAR